MKKTKASLHNALIGLAREKPYPSIAVKEILDRADVGRSTFYTHFRDKDDLLESGIYEVLRSLHDQPRSGGTLERIVAFSLPLLHHIDQHRRAGPEMSREGRQVMHDHLEDVLTTLVTDDLMPAMPRAARAQMPADLVARHIASTFVIVLNRWVESDPAATPDDTDARFRALVMPTLASLLNKND